MRRARSRRDLARAASKSYATLREQHVADHKRLFDRVTLDLGASSEQSPCPPTSVSRASPTIAIRRWRRSTSSSAATS
jgi:alpha-L-fucosidase 2